MVRPRRFERLTPTFGGLYSIQLSYERERRITGEGYCRNQGKTKSIEIGTSQRGSGIAAGSDEETENRFDLVLIHLVVNPFPLFLLIDNLTLDQNLHVMAERRLGATNGRHQFARGHSRFSQKHFHDSNAGLVSESFE